MRQYPRTQEEQEKVLREYLQKNNNFEAGSRIAGLWPGGTIASVIGESGLRPGMTGDEFYREYFPPALREAYPIDWVSVQGFPAHGIDSTKSQPVHQFQIAEAVHQTLNIMEHDPDQVYGSMMLSHGTDTLAETAAYLAFAIQCNRYALSIVAAQYAPGKLNSDAIGNVQLGLQATKKITEPCVVIGGKVHRAAACYKLDAYATDAFDSPHQPPLAELKGADIVRMNQSALFHEQYDRKKKRKKNAYAEAGRHLYFPGMEGKSTIVQLRTSADLDVLRNEIPKGIWDIAVIIAYAAGNVRDDIFEVISEVQDTTNCIIVPGARTVNAPSGIDRYEVSVNEKEQRHKGLRFNFAAMPPLVAEIKARWLLAQALNLLGMTDPEQRTAWVDNRMGVNFAGEIPRKKAFPDQRLLSTLLTSPELIPSGMAPETFARRLLQRTGGNTV